MSDLLVIWRKEVSFLLYSLITSLCYNIFVKSAENDVISTNVSTSVFCFNRKVFELLK